MIGQLNGVIVKYLLASWRSVSASDALRESEGQSRAPDLRRDPLRSLTDEELVHNSELSDPWR